MSKITVINTTTGQTTEIEDEQEPIDLDNQLGKSIITLIEDSEERRKTIRADFQAFNDATTFVQAKPHIRRMLLFLAKKLGELEDA